MAFLTDAVSSTHAIPSQAPAASRPGFFARVLHALMEARQRQADREIAQYLTLTGGKLTDNVEREIERRFLKG